MLRCAHPRTQMASAGSPPSLPYMPRHACQVCTHLAHKNLWRDATAVSCDPFVQPKREGMLPVTEHSAYILFLLSVTVKVYEQLVLGLMQLNYKLQYGAGWDCDPRNSAGGRAGHLVLLLKQRQVQ